MFIFVFRFVPYSAIALFPFVFVKEKMLKENVVLINHEKIHLRQQLELLILPFYLFYILNYLFNLVKHRSHYKAYLDVVFEREAYAKEKEMNYLKERTPYAFLHWIFNSTKSPHA